MLLWGLVVGIAASLPMLWLGSRLQPSALYWLWGTAIVLSMFGIRFLCFAYAAGILSLAHLAVREWVDPAALADLEPAWFGDAVTALNALHPPSLLALTAILHVAEALLMRLQGTKLAVPLYMEGKRGKLIGAYQMQGFWPAPLFLMVPAASGGLEAAWTPWFGAAGVWDGGWALLAFPVLFGYADATAGLMPREKLGRLSNRLLAYSVVVLAAALFSEQYGWLVIPTAVLLILMHEAIGVLSRFEEQTRAPRFVNDARGLCVLAVAPGGPADELGIRVGEIVHRVNGVPVYSKAGLHRALRLNAAFVKLEVLNLQGEKKFLQRALYEKEHHLLGMIVAPDNSAQYYVERRQPRLWSYLAARLPGTRWSGGAATEAGFVTADAEPAEVALAGAASSGSAPGGAAAPGLGEGEAASGGGETPLGGEAAPDARAAAPGGSEADEREAVGAAGPGAENAVRSGEAAERETAAAADGTARHAAAPDATAAADRGESAAASAAAMADNTAAAGTEPAAQSDEKAAEQAAAVAPSGTGGSDEVAPDPDKKPSE
jgi:hypothetical protein